MQWPLLVAGLGQVRRNLHYRRKRKVCLADEIKHRKRSEGTVVSAVVNSTLVQPRQSNAEDARSAPATALIVGQRCAQKPNGETPGVDCFDTQPHRQQRPEDGRKALCRCNASARFAAPTRSERVQRMPLRWGCQDAGLKLMRLLCQMSVASPCPVPTWANQRPLMRAIGHPLSRDEAQASEHKLPLPVVGPFPTCASRRFSAPRPTSSPFHSTAAVRQEAVQESRPAIPCPRVSATL